MPWLCSRRAPTLTHLLQRGLIQPEELIAAWTLLDGEWELVGNKTGATRLGFSLILKFFEQGPGSLGIWASCPRLRWTTWPVR